MALIMSNERVDLSNVDTQIAPSKRVGTFGIHSFVHSFSMKIMNKMLFSSATEGQRPRNYLSSSSSGFSC